MLRITVPATEIWDPNTEEFMSIRTTNLQLEHSLVSISKWESRWHKAFLGKQKKTTEEIIDYVRCMTITQNIDPNVFRCLSNENIQQVTDYIDDPMTATVFYNIDSGEPNRETPTAELIYYWMIALGIPFECQKWHLNRLLTLIRVCNVKNSPPRQRSEAEIIQSRRELNEARKKALNSKG